jgi:glycosyltransferase involved in cell wall biosynthesis
MKPLVSILIPAFNAEAFIADTIKSALAQTWPRKEIIIVNDGSTDQTLRIARQFACEQLSVIDQENQGAAAARNRAFSLASGDYIQWLDADDLLAPDKIAKQIAKVESCRCARTLLSSEWGYFFYRPQKAEFIPTPLWCDLSPLDWLVRKLDQNLFMQTATWLVSRELTEVAGPWDTRLLSDDDGEYFCRVLMASEGVSFVPGARVLYRRSPNSLAYIGHSKRKMDAHFISMQLHIGYLRSLEDSQTVRTACLKYLQRQLTLFYPERSDIIRQFELMARALGGRLKTPRLKWKYAWIRNVFGWKLAKRASTDLPLLKERFIRFLDKVLFRLENL